jgi:hypothetical protein
VIENSPSNRNILPEKSAHRASVIAERSEYYRRIATMHRAIRRLINVRLPEDQKSTLLVHNNIEDRVELTTAYSNAAAEFKFVTCSTDNTCIEGYGNATSYLKFTEQPHIKGEGFNSCINLTLKDEAGEVFPFLKEKVKDPPEALKNTIDNVICGFLPVINIFMCFGKWTHAMKQQVDKDKYTVSVKSTCFKGFYKRNTAIEYDVNGNYESITLITRGRTREPLTTQLLKEKIRKYIDDQQWNFSSRYEEQNQRIAAMLVEMAEPAHSPGSKKI